MLRRLAHDQNPAVIMPTHELELALRVSDRIRPLDGTRALACNTPLALGGSGATVDRGRMRFDPVPRNR